MLVGVVLVGCGKEPCEVEENDDGTTTIKCSDSETTFVGGRMIASYFCGGNLEGEIFNYVYEVSLMESGDILSRASIRAPDIEVGSSSFYSADQVGAASASVTFTFDLAGAANAGWWNMTLDRQTLVTTIEYNDADVTGGQIAWIQTPSDCIINEY